MFSGIKNALLKYVFLFSTLVISFDAKPCTAFVVRKDNSQFLAKNFDWFSGSGYMILNRRGIEKYAFGPDSLKITWVSRYESLTFNHMGVDFPLGGMNEKGLVIEELNAPPDEGTEEITRALNELQWIQYQLDNFSTVNQVIKSISDIRIRNDLFCLHYLVFDRAGNTAVIEIINGRLIYYKGKEIKYPVLSNNLYENLLKYLTNFKGFGGNLPILNHRDSQSRFVTVVNILENNLPVNIGSYFAFAVLDSVRQDDTRWSIVYDNINGIIYFKKSRTGPITKFIFSNFGNTDSAIPYFIDLDAGKIQSSASQIFTKTVNMRLYKRILNDYSEEVGSESPLLKIIGAIFKFGNNLHNKPSYRKIETGYHKYSSFCNLISGNPFFSREIFSGNIISCMSM